MGKSQHRRRWTQEDPSVQQVRLLTGWRRLEWYWNWNSITRLNQNLQLLKRSSLSQLQPCSGTDIKALRLSGRTVRLSSRHGSTGGFCSIPVHGVHSWHQVFMIQRDERAPAALLRSWQPTAALCQLEGLEGPSRMRLREPPRVETFKSSQDGSLLATPRRPVLYWQLHLCSGKQLNSSKQQWETLVQPFTVLCDSTWHH